CGPAVSAPCDALPARREHSRVRARPTERSRGEYAAVLTERSAAMTTMVGATTVAPADLVTQPGQIDAMVEDLRSGAVALAALGAGERAELARQCLTGVAALAERWSAV